MSSRPATPSPQLLTILDGTRLHSALMAALELRLVEHLSRGPVSAQELATRAGLATRGAQTLLDALVALELVAVSGGVYRNTPVAETFLLPTSPDYLGDEMVGIHRLQLPVWGRLAELARSGEPARPMDSPETMQFWELLTPLIARRGRLVAAAAIDQLDIGRGPVHLLDVGGGSSALYALALLERNPEASATQLDWPPINRAALDLARRAGMAERLAFLDGDLHLVPLPQSTYDVAVLSNIVHQESPTSNRDLLARLRASLRPGGRLVVSEFVVDDGRAGPVGPLLFNLNMLAMTHGGQSYTRSELTDLITGAGFTPPTFTAAGPFSTLVVAKLA